MNVTPAEVDSPANYISALQKAEVDLLCISFGVSVGTNWIFAGEKYYCTIIPESHFIQFYFFLWHSQLRGDSKVVKSRIFLSKKFSYQLSGG